ncbi:MAG: fimbrillin family protein, partial [Mediterranea sp.]|nr:fimbrillin family protein [Mediterranea sp.]
MNKDLKAFLMKLVWSLACLPFALLSCTDNSDTAGAATGVVGFNTAGVDPALARTAIVDIASLKNTGFRVNAYYTGTEAWSTAAATATPGFMYNQFVEWKANAWTYSPTKYWPGLTDGVTYGKISFFAWNEVAGAVVSANTATGAPALTFTVANNNADQKDLVADVRTDEDVSGGSVGISFSHVLSRIGFTARLKDTYPGVTVTITSLKVKYKADAVESTGIYTFGDDDHADGTWTYPATKTYMSNTGDEVMTANVVLDSDPAKVKRVNGESNYLMLLPQTIAYGAISIEVTWDVDGISQKKTINLPDQVWQPEKCYDYVLVISAEQTALDPIVVNPWDDSSAYKPAKLIYHANGGTGNDVEQFVMTNIACPVIENSFAHPLLYSLKEWNTKADGTGTSFQPGDLFTCFTNTDLYAQWWGVIDLADPTKLPVGVTFAS